MWIYEDYLKELEDPPEPTGKMGHREDPQERVGRIACNLAVRLSKKYKIKLGRITEIA